jgi:hypothetical protein
MVAVMSFNPLFLSRSQCKMHQQRRELQNRPTPTKNHPRNAQLSMNRIFCPCAISSDTFHAGQKQNTMEFI